MSKRDIASWNALISGLAQGEEPNEALSLFKRIGGDGFNPNEITVLGLVDEGYRLFTSMQSSGLTLNVKHYGSVVDLLGRAGRLQQAFDVINSMPIVPETSFVLHDIGDEEKENALYQHSEKLAVAYGLVCANDEDGTPIQVIKNLRICGDCHVVMKLVSKMYNREIIVRDRVRFHRFKDGICSCRDYW
ncbi:Pentatricopeptide repeat-containing protein At1g34160 [Linum perenne]